MDTFVWILFIIILSIGTFIAYNYLSKYLLYRVKINRWIILVLAILVMLVPGFLPLEGFFWMGLQSAVFVLLFLWFIDLSRIKKEEAKRIKIKPKAKPNRVKHNMKDKK